MGNFKYISKHRSKSGKWVYVYKSDGTDPESLTEYAKRKEENDKFRAQALASSGKHIFDIVNSQAQVSYSNAVIRTTQSPTTRHFIHKILNRAAAIAETGVSRFNIRNRHISKKHHRGG